MDNQDAKAARKVTSARGIAKAIGTVFSADVLISIVVMLFSVTLARTLGAASLGLYAEAFVILILFEIIVDFGSDLYLAQRIGADTSAAAGVLRLTQRVKFALWSLLVLPVLLFIFLSESRATFLLFAIPTFWVPLRSYSGSCTAALRGFMTVRPLALVQSLTVGAMHLLAAALLLLDGSLLQVFGLFTVFELLRALALHRALTLVMLDKVATRPPTLSSYFSSFFWRDVAPLALLRRNAGRAGINVLTTAVTRAVILLLERLVDQLAVGYYSAAARFITAARILPGAIFQILLPEFSHRLFVNKPTHARRVFAVASIVGIVGSLCIMLLAEPLIIFLFGEEFRISITLLQILAWRFASLMLMHVLEAWLLALGYESGLNCILAVELTIIVGGALYFVPQAGLPAVAWVALAASVISVILCAVLVIFVKARRKKGPGLETD